MWFNNWVKGRFDKWKLFFLFLFHRSWRWSPIAAAPTAASTSPSPCLRRAPSSLTSRIFGARPPRWSSFMRAPCGRVTWTASSFPWKLVKAASWWCVVTNILRAHVICTFAPTGISHRFTSIGRDQLLVFAREIFQSIYGYSMKVVFFTVFNPWTFFPSSFYSWIHQSSYGSWTYITLVYVLNRWMYLASQSINQSINSRELESATIRKTLNG